MKSLSEEHPEKYNTSKDLVDEMLPKILSESLAQKVAKYEDIANKIYKRSKDRDHLLKIAKEEDQKVAKSPAGNYQALVKAKIYKLAANMVPRSSKRKKYRDETLNELKSIFKSLLHNSKDDDFFTDGDEANYILPELIYQRVNKLLIPKSKNSYQKRLSYLASWFIKFEIKKLVSKDKPLFVPILSDDKTTAFYKRLENYWLNTTYEKNLNRYKERTLKYKFRYYVEINPSGHYNYDVMEAMNYIFK